MDCETVVFLERGRTLTASIGCEIDHHTARKIRERIDREIFLMKPEMLVLDFSSVSFMDSSGIALIIGRCETASALGASVHLVGLSEPLLKLVRLSGIEKVKNLTLSKGEL